MTAELQVVDLQHLPELARQAVETLIRGFQAAPGSPEDRLETVRDVERELARFSALVRS